ncbi:T9SS type B sorting domain-containing protein, partial [Flagellimonas onchidii]|uniref:T9SS type B sorting domain-containing protein n=1 Tax=Flagellimonas onchidii TaxID=2562684 RepID=UPI00197A7FF6
SADSQPFTYDGDGQLPVPDVPLVSVTPENCNGAATNVVSNHDGTLDYTSVPNGLSVDGSGNITGGTTGTDYVLRATNAEGCSADSQPFTYDGDGQLPVPDVPLVSVTPESCNGIATNVVSNHDGALDYTSVPNGLSVDGSGNITGGTTGTDYVLRATNAEGCSADSQPFTYDGDGQLPVPDVPLVSVTPESCNGAATNVVSNHDGALDYTSVPNGLLVDGSGNITGGTHGTDYVLTATNAEGCSADSQPFTYDGDGQLPVPTIAINGFSDPTACGGNDGLIVLNLAGVPNGSYDIVFDGGTFNAVPVVNNVATITGLGAGNYHNMRVILNGCISLEDPDVTLSDPSAPSLDSVENVEVCESYILPTIIGTSLTGNQTYYDMPDGGGSQYLPGDEITNSTTLYIYDENGTCSDQKSFDITIYPRPLVDALPNETVCGSYELPSLTNGNYFDAPNGGGNALNTGDEITNVGVNTVYVYSPSNGTCPAVESSFTVTINGLETNISVENESCLGNNDAFINVQIANGAAPYSVSLDSGPVMVFANNSFIIDELSTGNYSLSISDANGCEVTEIFDIQTEGVNLNATVNPIYGCDSGSYSNSLDITLLDSSVVSNVMYAIDSTDPNDFMLDSDFTNVSAGSHFLAILHTNGCMETIPFEIEDRESLNLSLNSSNINQIVATVTGGTAPYTYFFNDEPGSSENTYSITYSGVHTVRVLDGNGCEVFDTISLEFLDIEIPNFFTPNNDGQNDTWNPKNIAGFPNIETIIFDRYGREIRIIGALGNGWDGVYEGKSLPSGDYWYIVKLNDGSEREFVGNFTLYR